jgi:multidrug resistance efflux pump
LLGVSTVVGIGVGGFYYVSLFSYENTDDALVEGHMVVPVGPRVARRVAKVHVTEPPWGNQGELVVEIARRGFEARLATARAAHKFPSLAMDVAGITSTDRVQEASSAVEDTKPSLAPRAAVAAAKGQKARGQMAVVLVDLPPPRTDLMAAEARQQPAGAASPDSCTR